MLINEINKKKNTPVQKIKDQLLINKGISLYIKRDDLTHPFISGNKWRKLKYNLIHAKENNYSTLITFGGAYSNHIAALASAGQKFGFETIGIIRGDELIKLNPTLHFAKKHGMVLKFITRTQYKELTQNRNGLDSFLQAYPNAFYVPEGGSNKLALKGVEDMVIETRNQLPHINFDYWATACGTGGTAAGLLEGLKRSERLIAFSVLKGNFQTELIHNLLSDKKRMNQLDLNSNYHFGGYAKWNMDLIKFINNFKTTHDIPLDPIYTGKMLFGVLDLVKKGIIKENSTILAIHTGGLQGIEGFNQRFNNIIL